MEYYYDSYKGEYNESFLINCLDYYNDQDINVLLYIIKKRYGYLSYRKLEYYSAINKKCESTFLYNSKDKFVMNCLLSNKIKRDDKIRIYQELFYNNNYPIYNIYKFVSSLVFFGYKNIVKYVLNHYTEKKRRDIYKNSFRSYIIDYYRLNPDNMNHLTFFLNKKIKINEPFSNGMYLIQYITMYYENMYDALVLFQSYGVDMNIKDYQNSTLLHYMCMNNKNLNNIDRIPSLQLHINSINILGYKPFDYHILSQNRNDNDIHYLLMIPSHDVSNIDVNLLHLKTNIFEHMDVYKKIYQKHNIKLKHWIKIYESSMLKKI